MSQFRQVRRMWVQPIMSCLALLAGLLPSAVQAGEPLNILLLYADDWRYDTLGAAGNDYVQTPVLDNLSLEGIRFTNAAVTTAICGASRASLLTGQWMSRHGQRDFGTFDTPWTETLPGRLRAAGYQVAHIGKWHSGKFPAEHFDFGRAYHGTHWMEKRGGRHEHVTARNQADALDFLRNHRTDQPFFLQVAFFAPHAEDRHPLQYLPQPQSYELYNEVPVPVPSNMNEASIARLPEFLSSPANEGRNRFSWRFDTPGKYQSMMKNYFRLVSEVDAACGTILEEINRLGLRDNTLVIFTSDNGYLHGEHGLADKWYPFEESIRVPLIVRDPREPAARGLVVDEWALNVDLAPTILEAAGTPVPAGMQGTSLSPLYTGPAAAGTSPDWRRDFFYEHPTIRSLDFIPASQALVGGDWKYVLWPDFGREQLFHLPEDPHEEHDRINDPEVAEQLASLRERFAILKEQAL